MVDKLNRGLFKGKTVLDVGCGSGLLALFAAKAGAKAVYCVEYTPIANVARAIVAANRLERVVTVLQGKIEEVALPVDSVDIIISEWMGYFGLFEGMFRSVLWARDRCVIINPQCFSFCQFIDSMCHTLSCSFRWPSSQVLVSPVQFG
jgi:predicted RNA methylase